MTGPVVIAATPRAHGPTYAVRKNGPTTAVTPCVTVVTAASLSSRVSRILGRRVFHPIFSRGKTTVDETGYEGETQRGFGSEKETTMNIQSYTVRLKF